MIRISKWAVGPAVVCLAAATSAQISFDDPVNVPVGTRPQWTAAGLLNADSFRDLAVTVDAPDSILLLFNDGTGSFGASTTSIFLPAASGPHAVVVEDFDGDGDSDLAVSLKNSNAVQLLLNDGAGSFSSGSTPATAGEPRDLVAGDADGDGDLDLMCVCRSGDAVSILINDGRAIFSSTSMTVGADPRGVALGDFEGDGDLDLAVSSHDDRTIQLYSNDGAGGFALTGTLSTPADRPGFVSTADLDRDGDPDLVTAAGDFAYVFMNAGGVFTGPTLNAVGMNPSAIASGDFDVEGDVDLVTANEGSNSLSVLSNGGSGSFGAASTIGIGTAPQHVIAQDLNGDRSLDLVATNRDSGNVSVLLNQNDGSQVAVATIRNGSGVNALCYGNLTPPAIGTTWSTRIDHSANPSTIRTVVVIKANAVSGAIIGAGEILVGNPKFLKHGMMSSGTADTHSLAIPFDVSFVGLFAATQGVIIDSFGGFELCNAIDITVGY